MRNRAHLLSRTPAANRLRLALAILLAASLACSLPTFERALTSTPAPNTAVLPGEPAAPTPTEPGSAAAPSIAAQPTGQPAEQTNLPPALIEVSPPPSSELGPEDAPVFYFNQPMDRASVEAAFDITGQAGANLEWINDSAVRLVPDPAAADVGGFDITIGSEAKGANGLALSAPVAVHYQGPGTLVLAERLPAPSSQDVNPSSAVAVTFNRPVIALGGDAESQPVAFTLEPPAPGRGEWLNTSTYIFYPEPALLGGSSYTVRLNRGLTAANGATLAADDNLDWSFITSRPALLMVEPTTERPVALDSAFKFTFNQPMDRGSVEANLSLLRADGESVPGTFTWNDAGTEVTFTPEDLLERSAEYNLILLGAAQGVGGAAVGEDFAAVIVSVPQFGVTQTRPSAGETLTAYSGYGTVFLTFSAPVAARQDYERLISVSPDAGDLSVSRSFEGDTLIISGYFEPSASYTLTVAPELQDRWGDALDVPYAFTFSTEPATPSLMITARQIGTGTIFVPQEENSIPARATNITQIELKSGSVPLGDFIRAANSYPGLENWSSYVQSEWTIPFSQETDVNQAVELPLTPDRSPLPAGLYFLQIETQPAGDQRSEPTPSLLVVSPVQMVMKVSARQVFVWAVHTASSTPVENTRIDIYNSSAALITSCTTGADGTCQDAIPVQEDLYNPLYAVIGEPGDANFSLTASNWTQGIAPWDFGLSMFNKGDQPEIYLYTDRPIYQPGQTLNFRLIARSQDNTRYSPPPMQQLTVEIISPYDPLTNQSQVLTTLPLTLDAFGAAHGSYRLPEDANPGQYLLRVREAQFVETRFNVAAYRKPEIDLQVSFAPSEVLVGSDLQAAVDARYFFGAPAGNLPVRWTLYRSPAWTDLPDGLSAGPLDLSWLDPYPMMGGSEVYITEGQGQTNADGTLNITIAGEALRERLGTAAERALTYTLEVTVEDESGLPVSARAEAHQHPAPYVIGVRPEAWVGQSDEEITFTIRTLDWANNPVPDAALTARFSRIEWQVQESADPMYPPSTTMESTEAGSTDFRTSSSGEARLAFTPTAPGTYLLEVSGGEGAITQIFTWIAGSGSAPWPVLPNQRLTLRSDRGGGTPGGGTPGSGEQGGRYSAAETARIFIPNPFAGEALALVTVERGKVMRSSVLRITGASHELELPIAAEDAPNIYVSVTLLGRTGGRPDFRLGYLELAVNPAEKLLQVELQTSPEQPQPGGDMTLTLRARDSKGQPAQASFSLALVDKAVLALADPNSPAIAQAFYGRQPLGVQSSLSLVTYAGRMVYSPPGRGGGGGGDMQMDSAVRSRFEDTAYWNGSLKTDVNGVAQVTFTLPDNLTTWRVDARGVDAETRVGQAQMDVVVSKPLLLTPVTPRFAVAGDHLELAAVVFNNTKDTLRAGVRLETAGFTQDEPNDAVQAVEILPGDRLRVNWWGTVQNVDALDLAFSVETTGQAGEATLRDAARPVGGLLPVLRYSSPQTFGTSGMLAEAGERLEAVSLPATFTPTGGALRIELAPSLSAVMLEGLKALEVFPYDFTEATLSRLLPNLAALQALRDFQLEDEALNTSLESAISEGVSRLSRLQNDNGGWGWTAGYASDPYISSYAALGLSRAAKAGSFVDPQALQRAQDYLAATLFVPSSSTGGWQLDRLAFQSYVLLETGRSDINLSSLYDFRDALSPWGKAFLAMALELQTPGDERARTLLTDLEASASRSASGASWQDANPNWRNWSTPNFTTAVVTIALARIDPASQVMVDALRYLVTNRRASGVWSSSYETSWSLMALIEAMRGTGELQASYTYAASLNDTPVIEGAVSSPAQAVNPVEASIPLSDLRAGVPNALEIQRGEGSGRLYYRAFLRADRPAEEAPAVQRGLAITRRYYLAGQDCRSEKCQPLEEIDLSNPQPVQVRLTLSVPEDMYYVMVEDVIPAGSEVLNPRLKTSQMNPAIVDGQTTDAPLYNLANPFSEGWGWWRFNDPQVFDDRVRWTVDFLPAGTYELTYRITPYLAGEFRVLPARAWQVYFPDVEGASQGEVIVIR